MFKGPGMQTPRTIAEKQSNPADFRELTGYNTVYGRPDNLVTKGEYREMPLSLGQPAPAPAIPMPFEVK